MGFDMRGVAAVAMVVTFASCPALAGDEFSIAGTYVQNPPARATAAIRQKCWCGSARTTCTRASECAPSCARNSRATCSRRRCRATARPATCCSAMSGSRCAPTRTSIRRPGSHLQRGPAPLPADQRLAAAAGGRDEPALGRSAAHAAVGSSIGAAIDVTWVARRASAAHGWLVAGDPQRAVGRAHLDRQAREAVEHRRRTQPKLSPPNVPVQPTSASRRRRLAAPASSWLQVITTSAPTRPSQPSRLSSQSLAAQVAVARVENPSSVRSITQCSSGCMPASV